MSKMSITRALAEIKTTEKKIEKLQNETDFIGISKGNQTSMSNGVNIDSFVKNLVSTYDSIRGLIAYRDKIKAAIIESNAFTKVNINNTDMTVAAAIDKKNSLSIKKNLLMKFRTSYTNKLSMVEKENKKIQDSSDTMVNAAIGNDKSKMDQNFISQFQKQYLDENQYRLVDPLNLSEEIKALDNEIDEFTKNIDFILNESNTITQIEI